MRTKDAIDHYGSVLALAAALRIWPHNIKRWGDEVPEARAYELEVKTGGKLKAKTGGGS